jgi:hypothetical protein
LNASVVRLRTGFALLPLLLLAVAPLLLATAVLLLLLLLLDLAALLLLAVPCSSNHKNKHMQVASRLLGNRPRYDLISSHQDTTL